MRFVHNFYRVPRDAHVIDIQLAIQQIKSYIDHHTDPAEAFSRGINSLIMRDVNPNGDVVLTK